MGNSESKSMTPEDCIARLFEKTVVNSDGTRELCMPHWEPNTFSPRCDYGFDEVAASKPASGCDRFRMTWKTTSDRDSAVRSFNDLYEKLCAIMESDVQFSDGDSVREQLSPAQFTVWDKHIRDFDAQETDELADISTKTADGESCTDEETKALNDHLGKVFAEAGDRVGGVCAYDVVVHAQRLCKLKTLDAPKTVIDNEANGLAQSLAINMFSDRMDSEMEK